MSDVKVKVNEDKGTITITLPLAPEGAVSSSGKSWTVATTGGNKDTGVNYKGLGNVVLGVNAYVKRTATAQA